VSEGAPTAAAGGHHKSLLGPIIGGVGVAALLAGAATYLVSNGKYEDARANCTGGTCPDASSRRTTVETLDTVALVSAIAGGVLVATGFTLFVLDRGHPAETPAGAWLLLGPTGGAVQGRF
jgi:hypothetical protein